MNSRLIYLTDDELSFLKHSWLHFETPSWQEGVCLIDEVKRLREEVNRLSSGCCTSVECKIGMKALADEIKRLRAQNDKMRGWLDGARSVIEAYQEPSVGDVEVK